MRGQEKGPMLKYERFKHHHCYQVPHLRLYSQMQRSEEEECKGGGAVEQAGVVPGPGQEQARQQAQDHVYVLVHAEGQEVPLGQCGADGHHSGGQVDYLQFVLCGIIFKQQLGMLQVRFF